MISIFILFSLILSGLVTGNPELSVRSHVSEHFRQARAQAIPHDLDTDGHEDKCREPSENVCTGLAQHPHQSVSSSVTHPDQETKQKHPGQRGEEMARMAVFKARACLVSQVGAKCDRDGDAARAYGDGKRQGIKGMLQGVFERFRRLLFREAGVC
jgi:hypothetical protein